ncbi:MAG: NADP-dependent glyceraldehyde-3-phosphate dehydrogenase [Chlamydiae bacterium]|nr:NADP-dependent glyceraldehyde-3-phosphate dehydrogenase [Chlamydiota bacterium]MBI3277118.1 NADP-dependent glyceraldehyde-3-phosphate dehydrogenase [Chlamydiota bacterium]
MKELNWVKATPQRDPVFYREGSKYLVGGEIREWKGDLFEIFSPVFEKREGNFQQRLLGRCSLLNCDVAKEALTAAVKAYDNGHGEWPTATVAKRIHCTEKFLEKMKEKRMDIAQLLCWEIAKPWADSLAEVDRTIDYAWATIEALKDLDRQSSGFVRSSGFFAQIRRSPYGVALCMGPYNYPLNETFATLIPALMMGNPVIVKLPRLGMLCNMPLLEAFADSFPPGVINIISGEGSTVVTPIIESGQIDLLAFIGSAKVANLLNQRHPRPNRLRSVLGLGAKNVGIVLKDADLEMSVKECLQGALTFNGQRCTALKLLFVHRSIADEFIEKFCESLDALKGGMPFEDGVALTPLPEKAAVEKMSQYVDDAIQKGAKIRNKYGGDMDRTYFHPAVLYPVQETMRVWTEEQFGPVVPISPFDDPNEVIEYLARSPFGQQASLFGKDSLTLGKLIDALVNQVCRVNLNTQCRRGPDTFPFGGRKDSAEGTLSVTDALRSFSIRTVVAAKNSEENFKITRSIVNGRTSQFLSTDYLF